MPTPPAFGRIGRAAHQWLRIRQVLDESLVTFFKEDALTTSASIAYFAMLSIFPMLLLLVSLSGVYIRRFELSGELTQVLEGLLPMKPDFIMKELVQISRAFGRITLISIALLFWSSSGVFLPLEKALNGAWQVKECRPWWRSYLIALEMALLFGAFILLYAAVISVNVYIQRWSLLGMELQSTSGIVRILYQAGFAAITFGMALLVFIILFKRLPNRYLKIREALPGAFLTAFLWEGARAMFTLFLPRFNYSHVYGSIGVVVALMTWLYISSAVTLFGAHVSRSLYKTLKNPSPVAAPEAATPSATPVQPVGEAR